MKAREEIDRVLGEKTEISYQDAVELKYVQCIFKESLRLYPPAASCVLNFFLNLFVIVFLSKFKLKDLLREAPENIVIDGYNIPKGSLLQV